MYSRALWMQLIFVSSKAENAQGNRARLPTPTTLQNSLKLSNSLCALVHAIYDGTQVSFRLRAQASSASSDFYSFLPSSALSTLFYYAKVIYLRRVNIFWTQKMCLGGNLALPLAEGGDGKTFFCFMCHKQHDTVERQSFREKNSGAQHTSHCSSAKQRDEEEKRKTSQALSRRRKSREFCIVLTRSIWCHITPT